MATSYRRTLQRAVRSAIWSAPVSSLAARRLMRPRSWNRVAILWDVPEAHGCWFETSSRSFSSSSRRRTARDFLRRGDRAARSNCLCSRAAAASSLGWSRTCRCAPMLHAPLDTSGGFRRAATSGLLHGWTSVPTPTTLCPSSRAHTYVPRPNQSSRNRPIFSPSGLVSVRIGFDDVVVHSLRVATRRRSSELLTNMSVTLRLRSRRRVDHPEAAPVSRSGSAAGAASTGTWTTRSPPGTR